MNKMSTGTYINVWEENPDGSCKWNVYVLFHEATDIFSPDMNDQICAIVTSVMEEEKSSVDRRVLILEMIEETFKACNLTFYDCMIFIPRG